MPSDRRPTAQASEPAKLRPVRKDVAAKPSDQTGAPPEQAEVASPPGAAPTVDPTVVLWDELQAPEGPAKAPDAAAPVKTVH